MSEVILFFHKYIFFTNILFLIAIIFLERKRPVYTLFWITLLILAPYLGFIFYLFFGLSFRKLRVVNTSYDNKFLSLNKKIQSFVNLKNGKWGSLITYLELSCKNNLSTFESLSFFYDGNNFFNALLSEIETAKENIRMEYFIFKNDKLGKKIAQTLIKKANEGVNIKIIIDGAGGYSRLMVRKLRKNGIEVGIFFPAIIPIFKIANLRANYRDHRKITIIDDKIAFIGGFNIGDEYLGVGKLGYWRDTGIKITGDIVYQLEQEFFFSWNISKNKKNNFEYNPNQFPEIFSNKNKNYAQIVSSGPNYQFRTMRDNFLRLITEANKTILIQTPYFVPDDTLLDALKMSALSGVKIKIIIPSKPDHPFIYWINQYFVGELVKLGVEIYQYEKGFIHSKLMIIDDEVATLGTANFDYRSFYQNFEININLYNNVDVKNLVKQFCIDIENSKKISEQEFNNRSLFSKIKESICRLLAPVM